MAASSLHVFQDKKRRGEQIAMVSLYDAPGATLCCDAGVDVLLVGDSLGNVILGQDSTIPVTMADMLRHSAAVLRGVKRSSRADVPVIVDMPFGSYHGSHDSIVRNGVALMQAGIHGLKLEGAGSKALEAIDVLTQMGAPVMGHLGFTPQSALTFQDVVQGKTTEAASRLLEAAQRLEAAGCFALVLEVVPIEVAERITQQLKIPTIGIGAGPHCDGQVLVWHDLTGLTPEPPFRFVKRYAEAHSVLTQAARDFVDEVHTKVFPAPEHGWAMPDDELVKWHQSEYSAATDNEHKKRDADHRDAA